MVVLTSRVVVIAASISLTAILNAPTVEGLAIPVPVAVRFQEVVRQAMIREESPILNLPRANSDLNEEHGEKKNKRSEKGGERLYRKEVLSIHAPSSLFGLKVNIHNGSKGLSLKRSTEQMFFHIRRGYGLHLGLDLGHGLLHRSSSSRRSSPDDIVKARDESNRSPGHIELKGLESGKNYGSLLLNTSSGDIDASADKATIWYLISVLCPNSCGFKNCASFAMFDTSDKNRCITYSSSLKERSHLHGDYCWDQAMANEEAALARSQIFGYDPESGHLEPLPNDSSTSSQSSTTRSLQRRQKGEEVTMTFRKLEQSPDVKSSSANVASGSTESTAAPTSTDTSAAAATATATDTSTATATSTETRTLTVTVTADSEPTSSTIENVSTASTTDVSSTQMSAPLQVKVFGNTSSSTTDDVSTTSVGARTTGPPASTITPSSSVDGDAVASSIAAEDSSSNLASTTAAAGR
ncbi:hypothetical protein L218DRAFT_966308 [Marasmius fiardii PR-910]|nr:hypothetical protein L218DRAFT_966308 [Marasmius fiardii PR-910]